MVWDILETIGKLPKRLTCVKVLRSVNMHMLKSV